MNKLEKAIATAAVENIFTSSVRKHQTDSAPEPISDYNLRMKTSIENGCNTLIKLIESDEGNKQIVLNTLLFLEEFDALDENYTLSEILEAMTDDGFNGEKKVK